MDIWYFYLAPGVTLNDEDSAPAIHIRETIRALRTQGHEVRPCLYEDTINQVESTVRRTSQRFSQENSVFRAVKPLLRDIYELYQNVRDTRSLAAIFRENSIDMVYERLVNNKSAVSACTCQQDIPFIVESNAPVEERKKYWGAPLCFATSRLEKTVLQRADAVIVVSSPLKKHYERMGIDARKIFVLPNGVNEERFSPESVSRNIRAELGLDDKVVVGFVGHIFAYHGIELFLLLARTNLKSRSHFHFLIVGGGQGRDELCSMLNREGLESQFTFIDPVPNVEVPNYLVAMDICLLPRFMWYGSPMKIFEYGVMGKVIVAPDQENIRDVLTHGETALLFKPEDTSALIRAIQELAKDEPLRARLGIAARKHILANHTWTKNAERILEIYRQVTS
jgi:glycosyltransferase involved in cell wall biosynthesis